MTKASRAVTGTGFSARGGAAARGPRLRAAVFCLAAVAAFGVDLAPADEGGLPVPAKTPARTGQNKGGADLDQLQNFLRLNESLPRAVCDEAVVSRPPTLSAASEEASGAPLPELTSGRYEFRAKVPESRLISFLMEDSSTLMAAGELQALWKGVGEGEGADASASVARLREVRRRISLEVCTAVVTPGKVKSLISEKPGLFLQLRKLGAAELAPKRPPGSGEAVFHLRDVEGRFSAIAGKWWTSGWIEPYEVVSAFYGGREYRRLANPVTNQMQFVQILGPDDLPLGYLFPTKSEIRTDWKTLQAQAESPEARAKKLETYRLLIELEAYRSLLAKPGQADSIRKLQEFYKSLINAYQLYPEDERFAFYSRSEGKTPVDVRKILNGDFFKALTKSGMNGAKVALGHFEPDPRLHAIFMEYRGRLRQLSQ